MVEPIRYRIADAADLYRLTFDPDRDPAFTRALVELIGTTLPGATRPSAGAEGEPLLIWQGPHDVLIDGLGERRAALAQAVAGRAALLGDAGAGLVAVDLRGAGLAHYLAQDRPAGGGQASRVMRLADLRVTALWPGEGDAAVRLYVDRSHADYLAAWLRERWRAVDEQGG